MFRWLGESRVVVLRAPVGYGKSTLIGQWRDSLPHETRVAWTDSSTPEAAAYLWRGILEQLDPTAGADEEDSDDADADGEEDEDADCADADGEEHADCAADADADADVEDADCADAAEAVAFAAVRDALAATPQTATVLVLDGFYYADTDRNRTRFAQLLAEHANLRIVAASRMRLGFEGAACASVLTASDLALDPHETIGLANEYGATLDEDQAQAIVDVLGAWPALIDSAVRSLSLRPDSVEQVVDALRGLFDECTDLIDRDPAGQENGEQFARQRARGRATRGLLAALAQKRRGSGPGEWEAFESKLADAVEDKQWSAVATLLEDNMPDLIDADADLVVSTMRHLSERSLRRHPRTLALRRALRAAAPGAEEDGHRAPVPLDLSDAAGGKGLAESTEAALVGSIVLRRAGCFAEAGQAASIARFSLDAYDHHFPGHLTSLAPAARTQLALTLELACKPVDAAGQLSLALKAAEVQPQKNAADIHQITGLLSVKAALEGNHRDAEAWLDRCPEIADDGQGSWLMPDLPAVHRTTRAIVAIETLDRAVADHELAELRPEDSENEFWPAALWAQARYGLAWGDFATAFHAIEMAQLRQRERDLASGGGLFWLAPMTAHLLMATGQGGRANTLLRKSPMSSPAMRLAAARMDYLTGDDARVLPMTRGLLRLPRLPDRYRLDALLLQACSLSRAQGLDEAEPLWWSACDLAQRMGGPLAPFAMTDPVAAEAAAARVEPLARIRRRCLERGVDHVYPERLSVLHLTNREREVLEKIAEGASVASIAKGHYVACSTVKSQLRALYRKLGVHSRQEAVIAAREAGLL